MRTILNHKPIHPRVKKILEDFYGEALEDSDQELLFRKHLFEPLSELVFDLENNNQ